MPTFDEQFTQDFGRLKPDGLEGMRFEDMTPKALKRIREENLEKIVQIQDEIGKVEESVLYYMMAVQRLRGWERTYMVANKAITDVENTPIMRNPVDILKIDENEQ